MEEKTEKEATVYYPKKGDKKYIALVRFDEAWWHAPLLADEDSPLERRTETPTAEELKEYEYFILTITAEELKKTKNLPVLIVQKAQEELAKLTVAPPAPPAPAAPVSSGIAAASTLVVPPAAANTYSIYALIDKCRPEINTKLNPNYSLPEKSYDLVAKDGHKIKIADNGNIEADLAPLSSKNETEFAKHICEDLKAIVNMYKAMHEKSGIGLAAFPENKINLFVIEKDVTSEADKIKLARIKQLVAKEMHAYLSQPENDAIKGKFTVLGQPVTKPAPAPVPSAPPLSSAPKDAPKADPAAPGAPNELKMGPTTQPLPGSPRPK